MTTYLQDLPVLKTSWGNIALAISNFLERRAEHARLLRGLDELENLDQHMLQDVGLKGFEYAAIEEKKHILAAAIGQL